jgi:ribosomal protein S18 acetylase RimI-like enzyme
MVDRSVKFYDLFMLYNNLSKVTEIALPEGYSYRFFNGSDEDIQHWVDIVVSSGDVKSQEEGFEGFETYYRPYISELSDRCLFIINKEGIPVGTSTAFFLVSPQPGLPEISENPEPMPGKVTGHLHWVSIKEDYKRRGLSKPMITRTMKIMHELGYKAAFLHTQTPSWVACKIYLDLGWEPFRFVQSEEDFSAGWGIVSEKIV